MAPMTIQTLPNAHHDFVDADELRTSFALAMSAMYKKEVPLYGDLIRIVQNVNNETIANSPDPRATTLENGDVGSERLDLERHGAIRLGTPDELHTVRRMFEIIGMHPVGYYDLSQAGLPMHATCFRPISTVALKKNPFRVFTTLLRPDLLMDVEARNVAEGLLEQRHIFSGELLTLLDTAERQGGRLKVNQGNAFVQEAMKTFGWKPVASASKHIYERLKEQHPILADISCFQSAHINHLTPRTLNITAAQARMKAEGLAVKERIEGPPPRHCPILLRQTSFMALEERISFPPLGDELIMGSHKARFGEIEARGAAVMPAGRQLYDELLARSMQSISETPSAGPEEHDRIVAEVFARYPDSWEELRRQSLVYFNYRCTPVARSIVIEENSNLERLLNLGVLEAVPITYEDFLPMSAAGIFQSNLGSSGGGSAKIHAAFSDKAGYESALRRPVIDLDGWYADAQEASLRACASELGLDESSLLR